MAVFFQEVVTNTLHHKDLWNLDLYGPILLINPESRQIYANFPDSAGVLKQDGSIFTGELPTEINIANTAIDWNGRKWAMIRLPVPGNRQERLELVSHELFHRSQPTLGFEMRSPDNDHLDQKDGRVYLRLELAALWQAYTSKTMVDARTHLTHALIFRKYRYTLFPGAAINENLLELNEGIASYTGIVMSDMDEPELATYFEQKLTDFQHYPTFVRSFAYITTPLYGYILDRTNPRWNLQINKNTNLTDFFTAAFNLSVPDDARLAVSLIPDQYESGKIIAEETERENETKHKLAEYKARFITAPHLEIRFEKMGISFDPRNIIPLEGEGSVYPNLRISDNWGILTVTNGALVGKNWDKVTVSEPTRISNDKVTGDGWILDLNQGYAVEKVNTGGNYLLKKR